MVNKTPRFLCCCSVMFFLGDLGLHAAYRAYRDFLLVNAENNCLSFVFYTDLNGIIGLEKSALALQLLWALAFMKRELQLKSLRGWRDFTIHCKCL